MDPIDSGKGQDEPSKQSLYLLPSSRGRQRKKNPKFFDFETDDAVLSESDKRESPRKESKGKGATSQKNLKKGRKPKTAVQQSADGGKESTDKMPPDSVGQTVTAAPKKRGRRQKTKSVLKQTVTTEGNVSAGEAGETVAENSVQQENETPKRKYVKKKAVQVVEDPTCEKIPEEPPTEPEEEAGGRRRRKAANVALKYLHNLAKEVLSHSSDEPGSQPSTNRKDVSEQNGPKQRKGKRRKHLDGEAADDDDFVPDNEEADEMENQSEEDEELSDAESDIVELQRSLKSFHGNKHRASGGKPVNGLDFSVVFDSAETTKKFREEHYSSWVFSEWVPSIKDWDLVAESHLEKYLPEERESAAFKVTREGLTKEEAPQLRLGRFESLPAHSDRWDMFLFAGGPVWALEWCPTPDGAPATQYVALTCHRGMDDVHYVNQTYTEPGLVQLWDCGKLEYNSSPDSQPALVYGLAQDKGFIWQLKWCPAGGWEPPSCGRKAPFLPRLGLLAVATSNSVVTIYSLPHPDALLSNKHLSNSEKDHQKQPIYKARGVMTLKLGSIKAPREEKSGQVLSMDWLPHKPHNIMAIGFFDGVVGLWDLSTKSALLRVRESDRSLTLLPYRCIFAHDHAVRALAFCPASRYLFVTAGEDRYVKLWDLRRLFDPIRVHKRYLTNEICWLLDVPAVMMAGDSAFVPRGSMGIHLFTHSMNSYFAVPRNSTVWSMSYSEWLHCVVSADQLGEVILSLLPPIINTIPQIRRSVLKRFPAYFTSMLPCDEAEGDDGEMRDAEDEGHVGDGHEGGETEKPEVSSEGSNETNETGEVSKDRSHHLTIQTYKEAVKKHFLHYTDFNMRNLAELQKRPLWKRLKGGEGTAKADLDDMSLAALYRVRFNPNMSSHVWFASGGQLGLVRLHCLRTLITSQTKKMIVDNQTQFNTLYSQQDQSGSVLVAAERR